MAAHHHSGLLPEPEQSVGVDGRFATGACVMARYRDGKLRPAQVIDSRPARMSKSHAWDYYVHFIEYNRRMDGWVSGDDMELFDAFDASGMNEEEQEARKRKRKEAFHERLLEEDHEGMDAASLKEHEEVTKVKNVQRIEFGRWLIDAWYFSPFPKEYYADGVTDMVRLRAAVPASCLTLPAAASFLRVLPVVLPAAVRDGAPLPQVQPQAPARQRNLPRQEAGRV
eukprot:PLAT10795.3.p2 GENE.PLAT10795.3~~PLAT10795.3.p2  ORF type:complete len:226 (+),score=68.11 PLAT10795.3:27-704(+)